MAALRTLRPALTSSSASKPSLRAFSSSPTSRSSIDSLTVGGAGLMGAGIAQVAAQKGVKVTLLDVDREKCDRGLEIIKKSLARVAKRAHPESQNNQAQLIESALSNITTTTSLEKASSSSLIIEAILESLSAKHSLFSSFDSHSPPQTIFASNTSSLKIRDIASCVSEERRRRFVGLHFFNPVPQMKLVEVIRMEGTTEEQVVKDVTEWCKKLGKVPANCKDTPGFIVNRLLVPYLLEAMRMAERGDATPEDIDLAMKYGAGYPMGPFTLSDYVGLDTMMHITDGWRDNGEVEGALVTKVAKLEELVKEGKLGNKAGEGFYKYDKK